eukprot:Em0001g3653a
MSASSRPRQSVGSKSPAEVKHCEAQETRDDEIYDDVFSKLHPSEKESTLILFIAHQVFRMKVEEVLSGKTVCYVLVYCLPVEKVDATVRIECVVMDTSRIGTRVCIMSDAEKSNMGLLFVLLSILMLKAEPVTEGQPFFQVLPSDVW